MAKFLLGLEKKDVKAETTYSIWTNAGKIVPKVSHETFGHFRG